jgi:hypothetical protein
VGAVVDLTGTWRFLVPGQEPTTIDVPGFWEAQGHLELDGTVAYEREVEVPAGADYASLEFDAVADLCRVELNGDLLGTHEVGFTPFVLDASGRLRDAKNLLRVEIQDPPRGTDLFLQSVQGKQGWGNRIFPSPPSVYLTYGGIWQPCRLVIHGPLYLDDLWCDLDPEQPLIGVGVTNRSAEDRAAEVEVQAFGQTARLHVDVPAGGRAEVTTTFDGRSVPRWSPAAPALHAVRAAVDGHSRTIEVGLRRVERVGDEILVDGVPFRMRSALHQGFWPTGLYAVDRELVERDIELAMAAGLNSLRTHLKPFEPAWLDGADRAGLLLQCDTAIGEPLSVDHVRPDTDFGRRCITALVEQVRRDRSRPSIVMWTLMNEVGLDDRSVLDLDGYRDLAVALGRELRALDPSRPLIENDWLFNPERLHVSDIRAPHWYGRGSRRFLRDLDQRLTWASEEAGPLLVTEFGEWGLPDPEQGSEFWDNEREVVAHVERAGWPGGYAEFAAGTQEHQGWAGRVQAERLRRSPIVQGFCLTEWTDVPYELNGLVSLRRTPKVPAIEAFRPALADVALIAITDRYAYAAGEELEVEVCVSNWGAAEWPGGPMEVSLGESRHFMTAAPLPAGAVATIGTCRLTVGGAGRTELVLSCADATARYPVWVVAPAARIPVDVRGSEELAVALEHSGWAKDGDGLIVVAEDVLDEPAAERLADEVAGGRRAVVLAQETWVPLWGKPARLPLGWSAPDHLPTGWGPTPFSFTATGLRTLPDTSVLGPEVFHCSPTTLNARDSEGRAGLLVPLPIGWWGSTIAARRHSKGAVASCHLRIQDGLVNGLGFDQAVLAELARLTEEVA